MPKAIWANCLRYGQGVAQDYAAAADWYRKSADQGYVLGQYSLGVLYFKGQGVPHDPATAAKWLRKAADQGDTWSEYNLGVQYSDGEGVPQDYAMAAALYQKAADQGNALAQYDLAIQYAKGRSLPQDPVQAYKWVSLAVLNATEPEIHDTAAKTKDEMTAFMTKAQIAEADKQVKAWKPVPAAVENSR